MKPILAKCWIGVLISMLFSCQATTSSEGGYDEPQSGPPVEKGLTSDQLEEVQRVERVGRTAVVECYNEELRRRGTKDLKGTVTVSIHIGQQGNVLEAKIASSSLGVPAVHQCIQDVIGKWTFPPLRNDFMHSVTYDFSPAY